MPKVSWPKTLSVAERINLASEKTSSLIDIVREIIVTHETNRHLVYSDLISAQVPLSFAAHTFNQLQLSQHYFELLRLCACWDSAHENRLSIPSIAKLVDDPDVLKELRERSLKAWMNIPYRTEIAPEFVPIRQQRRTADADERTRKLIGGLVKSLARQAKVAKSDRISRLMNFRHRYIAHALAQTHIERARGPIKPPRFGEDRKLLRATTMILERFTLGIRDTDFQFADVTTFAGKCAAEFWSNCKLTIPDQRRRS